MSFLNNREHFRYSDSKNISYISHYCETGCSWGAPRIAAIVIRIHRRPPFPSASPCPRSSFSRAPKCTRQVRSVDRSQEKRWRRKRRKDPWHSGCRGRDGGFWRPRRASSASSESGRFCFLSVRAFASDKRVLIVDERTTFFAAMVLNN